MQCLAVTLDCRGTGIGAVTFASTSRFAGAWRSPVVTSAKDAVALATARNVNLLLPVHEFLGNRNCGRLPKCRSGPMGNCDSGCTKLPVSEPMPLRRVPSCDKHSAQQPLVDSQLLKIGGSYGQRNSRSRRHKEPPSQGDLRAHLSQSQRLKCVGFASSCSARPAPPVGSSGSAVRMVRNLQTMRRAVSQEPTSLTTCMKQNLRVGTRRDFSELQARVNSSGSPAQLVPAEDRRRAVSPAGARKQVTDFRCALRVLSTLTPSKLLESCI